MLSAGILGLEKYPLFIELRRGELYNLRANRGFEAYRYVNISGTISLQLPELNFFDVMKQNLDGRREVYKNVEIAAQPEELFSPPLNATVVTTDRVGGTESYSKEEIPLHMDYQIRGRQDKYR